MSARSLEKLRDLVTDLQLIDGTRGIISLFSARTPPEAGQIPGPLFPETLPEGAAYDQLIERVKSNEILRGKLLSEDGTLALIVLALEPAVAGKRRDERHRAQMRETMAFDLEGAGLTAQLSGVPIMQLEIRNAVERDRLIYNAFGFAAGCLIAIIFFRRVSFMIIAAGPPLIAILLALGALGWLDFRLNMFLNVMTPLIMVISFANSMQLTFAARDRLLAGEDKYHRLPQRRARRRAGLRADPRHRRHLVHRAAVLLLRPDPHLRRGGADGDGHRASRRADAGAASRRAPDPQGGDIRRQGARHGYRRQRAPPLLRLGGGAHGERGPASTA